MKTFLECIGEAAREPGDEGFMNWLIFKLDEEQLEHLARAANIYASQSNSHKHGVVQAEGSGGYKEHGHGYSAKDKLDTTNPPRQSAVGAAVASGAVGSQTSAREKTPCTCDANFYVGKRWCTKELNGHCG